MFKHPLAGFQTSRVIVKHFVAGFQANRVQRVNFDVHIFITLGKCSLYVGKLFYIW